MVTTWKTKLALILAVLALVAVTGSTAMAQTIGNIGNIASFNPISAGVQTNVGVNTALNNQIDPQIAVLGANTQVNPQDADANQVQGNGQVVGFDNDANIIPVNGATCSVASLVAGTCVNLGL